MRLAAAMAIALAVAGAQSPIAPDAEIRKIIADRIDAQLTGQPRLEIFASSEREFFLKVVDAQMTVEVDSQGRAAAVTLHQLGRDQRAARVE
jgi:hypothetical protein